MQERSRLTDPAKFFEEIGTIAGAMYTATHNGSIPPETAGLVQLRAGQVVGSTYHVIRQTGELRALGQSEERISAVVSWRDAPYFTDAERIALELVEAVLAPHPVVPDELFERACAHYDEKALWTLTLVIGQICFFVPVALIARPIPGRPQGEHYTS